MVRVLMLAAAVASLAAAPALADDPIDGTYDATVTTPSGTYTVPVEVEGGEVTHVYWPNGGMMSVNGGDLDDGTADGFNSRGDYLSIEVDDLEYEDDGEW